MGIPEIFAIVSIALAAGGFAFSIISMQNQPASMAAQMDVNACTVSEGTVIPFVTGRVRVGGNLVWYGNITKEAVEQGGKGMGGGGATQYNYYCD